MKKYLLSAALLVTGLSLMANHGGYSRLNLSMFDNGTFGIVFDQDPYDPCNRIIVDNIAPGTHYLKVVRYGRYSGFGHVVFHGPVSLEPGSEVFASIDPMNRFIVERTCALSGILPVSDPFPAGYPMEGFPGNSSGFSGFVNNPGFGQGGNCSHLAGGGYHVPAQGWWNPSCPYGHIDDADFMHLKMIVQNQWFDNTKAEVAMQAIRANHISAHQLRELLLLFGFESTRLRVAKFAYRHTCDKQRFFVVYDAFVFDSSVRELNRFIAWS